MRSVHLLLFHRDWRFFDSGRLAAAMSNWRSAPVSRSLRLRLAGNLCPTWPTNSDGSFVRRSVRLDGGASQLIGKEKTQDESN